MNSKFEFWTSIFVHYLSDGISSLRVRFGMSNREFESITLFECSCIFPLSAVLNQSPQFVMGCLMGWHPNTWGKCGIIFINYSFEFSKENTLLSSKMTHLSFKKRVHSSHLNCGLELTRYVFWFYFLNSISWNLDLTILSHTCHEFFWFVNLIPFFYCIQNWPDTDIFVFSPKYESCEIINGE